MFAGLSDACGDGWPPQNRAKPEKPPPRVIVLYGPAAVGVGRILDEIVANNPITLDRTISTTTRFPKVGAALGLRPPATRSCPHPHAGYLRSPP